MLSMYLITISIETPILLVGLSPRHSYGRRLFCGVWLTACTYPILWLVLPALIDVEKHYVLYLAVGETFVALAECAIFWAAFGTREEWGTRSMWRDLAVITLANLASFGFGELMNWLGWTEKLRELLAVSAYSLSGKRRAAGWLS
jgi:hypothetical protein